MPDLSHTACLWEAGPTVGAPNDADHVAVYESTSGSSGKPTQSERISFWRREVLAAEAKKAGSASIDTRLTPIIIIKK